LGVVAVSLFTLLIVRGTLVRWALSAADATFSQLDELTDEGIAAPSLPMSSGSPDSLIEWDTIGRQGQRFIKTGPTQDVLSEFLNKDALMPLRVYVGLRSRETVWERARLALRELKRIGAFDRSVLVVATPTGTGWLDPGAVDTLEYLHAGDSAIVSMQYSYLPSWITIMVHPGLPEASARALFNEIYAHWQTLPKEKRPKLYLHGLSLGALGSEVSADLFTLFENPIQGALWSGPPFASLIWSKRTRDRNKGSPMWLPTFRDGTMLRFSGQKNSLENPDQRWGPMRFVYLQYASDPMTFFSTNLLFREPEWLVGVRGPDVSSYLRWIPIVTFLQVAFDIPMSVSVPTGYGHNFTPAHYIDAWIAVTAPAGWGSVEIDRLKAHLSNLHPRP
jgi:uncharacterized membrane protein